jgi:hypothetical protein
MKRFLTAALLIVAFSSALISREIVAEGQTHTALGNYKIMVADKPVTINGEQLKTYVISYQNSPLEVTVAVKKEKDCNNYLVLSDKLNIEYVCNGNYFGVQKLEKSFEKEGFNTSDEGLNKSEYFHQKVITPGKQSELESTQYIAAYFPMLIKDEMIATK